MFLINLVFVDQKTIRDLNRKYRHLDKATTVLSFNYCAGGQAKFPSVAGEKDCLGEIIICPELAKRKKLTIEELIIHGYRNLLSEIPATNPLRT